MPIKEYFELLRRKAIYKYVLSYNYYIKGTILQDLQEIIKYTHTIVEADTELFLEH